MQLSGQPIRVIRRVQLTPKMQTLAPTWNLGNTATAKWCLRLFPSLNDVAFILPLFVLFARLKGTQILFSDGDTGWHIRTGEWILAHHTVPSVDLFSFSKPHAAWFAWEWGWDVLAALIHQSLGLAGIGFFTTLMLGLFCLLLYRLAFQVSENNVMSMAVTALAAAVSSIHWLARPHLVSWIFALVFMGVLESKRSRSLLILLPLLTVVWTNLHGGFVAGLMLIACYALGESLTAVLQSGKLHSIWKSSANYWLSLALCAAATFVNPYGWQLHRHIYSYLSDSDLLDKIQEFQSISFHAGPAIYLEILLLLAAFAVFQGLKDRQLTPVLLICLWAHLALLSARHIPLFAIAASPFVAAILARGLENVRQMPILKEAAETLSDICHDLRLMELTPRFHLVSAAAILLIAGLFALGQAPFAPEFNPENFPVQAIPIVRSHPDSRIFTTDQWGDYLLYRLYPAERVFFDGRSDFYGDDFVKLNQRLLSAAHDWRRLLNQFGINLVILKPEMPLSAALKLTPGAKVLLDDGKVIVFDTAGLNAARANSQVSGLNHRASRAPNSSQITQPDLAQAVLTTNPPKTKERKL